MNRDSYSEETIERYRSAAQAFVDARWSALASRFRIDVRDVLRVGRDDVRRYAGPFDCAMGTVEPIVHDDPELGRKLADDLERWVVAWTAEVDPYGIITGRPRVLVNGPTPDDPLAQRRAIWLLEGRVTPMQLQSRPRYPGHCPCGIQAADCAYHRS